jgi:CoA:oxalate CoA-transferase
MRVDHPQPAMDRPTIALSTFGMFKTLDGWVYIAADPQMRPRLERGMGVESLETTDELKAWAESNRTMDIVNALAPQSVPVAPVYNLDEMLVDPHVKEREIITQHEHPSAGTVRSPGFPVKLEKSPASIRLPAPTLGQHNEEVLTELLGYSKEQVVDLRKAGVIT